ncbi:DUF2061 domain-containing protein [Roseovarius gahaiensis]|uniref:DUF2061 domain-containing protein n=1 Tax=Roseovarius gahaiensis TaxID=2716691 RepID=A0A967EH24_9RHOB|nr:DUF2061 domain-containing protein [Roseovarius gahaiensis]NHQ75350.1 DUF2061 domain-containing protein [Roseovarius gahaiensis]
METRKRTLVKAVVWNIIGLTVMSLVGLAMTGSVAVGGAMALVNTAIGLLTYILYERLWSGIAWGRIGSGARSDFRA